MSLLSVSCGGTAAPVRVLPQRSTYSLLEQLGDAAFEPPPIGRVEGGIGRVRGSERSSILFYSPGRLRFAGVRIPPGAILKLGVGVSEDPTCTPGPATFDVRLATGEGREQSLWSRAVAAGGSWNDAEVPLASLSGRTADLVLSASFAMRPEGCAAAFSHPAIESRGGLSPPEGPLQGFRLVRDLLAGSAPPIDLGSFVGYGRLLQLPRGGVLKVSREDATTEPLRFSIDVPRGGELELSGEVLHPAERAMSPGEVVVFEARGDGRLLLRREMDARAAPVTFSQRIPIDALAGRHVSLTLQVRGGEAGVLGWWTSAWLLERRDVPRQGAMVGRNLLLVLVDTFRSDRLGLYGAKRDTTPNLDQFARGSEVFDRAVASCSWTQPSVATILTGRSPLEHGMVGGVPLDPSIETIAEAFEGRGISTYGLSSNPVVGRREGFHRGFETFVQVPWARADQVGALFKDWLEGHGNTRWFAYLHYIDPHDSYDAPPPLGTTFTSALVPPVRQIPWALLHKANFSEAGAKISPGELEYLEAAYDGELRYWDAAFGDLLSALGEEELRRTIVVVVGDHGEEFMDHGKLFHGYHLYDESVRVPLVVHAPGLVAPGREPRVFPLEGLKALVTDLMSGTPESHAAHGNEIAFSHTALAAGADRYDTLVSARDSKWKYMLDLDTGRDALFDLGSDPGERSNVSAAEPSVRSRYEGLLRAWVRTARPRGATWRDPDLVRRLRALGYIE